MFAELLSDSVSKTRTKSPRLQKIVVFIPGDPKWPGGEALTVEQVVSEMAMLQQLRRIRELQVKRELEFIEEHVVLTVIADRIEALARSDASFKSKQLSAQLRIRWKFNHQIVC